MHVPGSFSLLVGVLALALLLLAPSSVLAYGGGVELVGYFITLLAWVAVALGAVLMWPFTALLRRWRRPKDSPKDEPKKEPTTVTSSESPGEGSPTSP